MRLLVLFFGVFMSVGTFLGVPIYQPTHSISPLSDSLTLADLILAGLFLSLSFDYVYALLSPFVQSTPIQVRDERIEEVNKK